VRHCYTLILLLTAVLAHAETPLLWNQLPVKQNCPQGDDAVWVTYAGGEACIRFFSAGKLRDARQAVVLFKGDRVSMMARSPQTIPNNTADAQRRLAQTLLQHSKIPTVVVARPGTYGSSGNHHHRRQKEEFLALNASLNAIKARYGIQRFILSGHSGGATAASALLALGRRDIDCAVLSSGAWGLLERADRKRQISVQTRTARDTTGMEHPWDPLDHINGVPADPARLILILGNPHDRNTPFDLQKRFADALRQQGHKVTLLEQPAVPPSYHTLKGNAAMKAVAMCPHPRLVD
jgi:predicted esterase